MPFKDPQAKKAYLERFYAEHKHEIVAAALARKATVKQKIREHKEAAGCADCKGKFPYYVLDLDHREGEQKVAEISRMVRSTKMWPLIEEEMKKCDVVCANCHRIRTHNRKMALSSNG